MSVFRLVHVTDPHFRSWQGAHLTQFLGKRALGALNIAINRRRKHKMSLLEAMRVDLQKRGFDHLALTGDLSNIALVGEWRCALTWLEGIGAPHSDAVTVIPGNHDTYTEDVVESGEFETLFGAYQTADLRYGREHWPFARLRGDLAIVALNTCVATGDLGAWGHIGTKQLERLEAMLTAPEIRSRIRVILMHHPPVLYRRPEARNLRDRQELAEVLARTGAELVLHGHDHRDERVDLPGPNGTTVPCIGSGSASYAGRPERCSRYALYEFDGRAVTRVVFGHEEATGAFVERHREILKIPTP